MGTQLVVRRGRDRGPKLVFEALRTPWQRLRGLLGTGPDAPAVALVGCGRIHTVGMRYRIDVAFVTRDGLVLDVWRSLEPGRLVGDGRGWVTLERPHQRAPWLAPGEAVEVELVTEEVPAWPVHDIARGIRQKGARDAT